jgi:DNA-binding NarL/FixJ family response regulator
LRDLLEEQGIWVVGGGAPGTEALTQLVESRPDLALIDIDVGEESGLALARRLGEDIDGAALPKVILISTHDESEYADLIEASPAVGFLAKTDLSAALVRRMIGAGDG